MLLAPLYHLCFYKFSNPKRQKNNSTTKLRILAKKKGMVFIEGRQLRVADDKYYENSDYLNVNGVRGITKKMDSILKVSL